MSAAALPNVEELSGTQALVSENGCREKALVPTSGALAVQPNGFSSALGQIALELDVVVPIRDFRLRNLIGLDRGQVIESKWNHGEDLPLAIGKVQLAWTEFEVVDTRLAVRITRLA